MGLEQDGEASEAVDGAWIVRKKKGCLRNSEKFKIGSTDAKGSTQD